MKQILLATLLALLPLSIHAEKADSLWLMGWPRDAFTMESVIDSTTIELMSLDSTVIATTKPYWNEQYRKNSFFQIKVGFRSGEYLVRASNPEYLTTTKKFKVKVGKRDGTFLIGDIKMRRAPKSRRLGEAVVTATKIKFYTKGDTLVFNADAFNLAEGSMLDALVEQLPGAQLKRDGRIFMNGKMVESVLLNGKDFFRGNNEILLDNLPAYTVKHVKFYDKKSERAEALKIDLNDSRFVMDVQLKREYSIGWLANAEAGGGTHNRWLGRIFALRFTPQSRLTFFANANNTNETRKPGRSGDWSPAEMGSGLTTVETGGFDYQIDDKNNRYQIEGNASATHSDNDTETKRNAEYFQTAERVFKRSRQINESRNTSVNTNHKFRFMIGPENDKYDTQLYVKPRFNYSYSKNSGESLSAEFAANPIGEGNWESVFDGPEADKTLTGILINRVRTRQKGNSENYGGGVDFQLLRMASMEVTAGMQGNRSKSNSFDLYNLSYATGNTDNRHRYFHTPSDNFSANAGIFLPYSLLGKGFHSVSLSASLGYNYSHSRSENSIYRLDQLEKADSVGFAMLPSSREALMKVLDSPNSYISTTNSHSVYASVNFGYSYDVREMKNNNYQRTALWELNLTPGVSNSSESLDYSGLRKHSPSRNTWLPDMKLRLKRNTPGMMHQIQLDANYRQQLPPLFSLMGLRFDNDPLNIREGNALLKRTEQFSGRLWYYADRWGQKEQRRLNVRLNAVFYRNAVATAEFYNKATGVRTYRPENVNGNYNIDLMGEFSTPLDKKRRCFTLNLSFANYFYRSVDLQNTGSEVPVRSIVYTNYMTQQLYLSYRYNKMTVGLNGIVAWHTARSEREKFQDINGFNIDLGVWGNASLPWGLQIATDLKYRTRRGYDNAVMNKDNILWNAQLSKGFMKGNLTFALVGYDILNNISNLDYSVNRQGITETWRNVIPSYGMLRVIYKFNKQPKKRR